MPAFEKSYKGYACCCNAPLSCDQPRKTVEQFPEAKFCMECRFPATLRQQAQIRGSRGIYQVTGFVGDRGRGRLYTGELLGDRQPLAIKEYLLPQQCFNPEETRNRKQAFLRVAGVSPADGRVQDFRLIQPREAIADESGERCYLITPGNIETAPTLKQYLLIQGAMTASQVREVLNQTLQTLQFLHTQKLVYPDGQVRQGMAHGNISLDSLLLVDNQQQFYIYLCDLAAWERLFDPPPTQSVTPEPKQDLIDLGWVAFYLWVGQAGNDTIKRSLDPNDCQWPHDPSLKQFICCLLGVNKPFESAEAARQALLKLPHPGQADSPVVLHTLESKPKQRRTLWLLLGITTLLLSATAIWYFRSPDRQPSTAQFNDFYKLPERFSDINGVPDKQQDISYVGEKDGTWNDVLARGTRESPRFADSIVKPKPDAAQFSYQVYSSADVKTQSLPLEAVKDGKAAFAITSLSSASTASLTNELVSNAIAYDGLILFVPFSVKDANLLRALEGGIRLEELRQIYTDPHLTNWQQLRSGFPDVDLKPYAPKEPEALRLFEQIVLADDPALIRSFHSRVLKERTEGTLQKLVFEYEQNRVGIISFGLLSKTWNQCQAYPLALKNVDNKPIHAVIWSDGNYTKPSEQTKRCNRKELIRLNVPSFESKGPRYQLGYPLTVVYRRSEAKAGSKFAEMLMTQQGQKLLRDVGLVPLQPIPDN